MRAVEMLGRKKMQAILGQTMRLETRIKCDISMVILIAEL
jgi:hypothetical protein